MKIIRAKIYVNGSHRVWEGSMDDLVLLQKELAAKQVEYKLSNGTSRWHYGIQVAQSGIVLSGPDMTTTIYQWDWII